MCFGTWVGVIVEHVLGWGEGCGTCFGRRNFSMHVLNQGIHVSYGCTLAYDKTNNI